MPGIQDTIDKALRVIADAPDDIHAMQELGYLFVMTGSEETAIGWLTRAVQVLERRGDWQKAAQIEERIIALLPRCPGRTAADMAAAQQLLARLEARTRESRSR